jgi:hypothetical protein
MDPADFVRSALEGDGDDHPGMDGLDVVNSSDEDDYEPDKGKATAADSDSDADHSASDGEAADDAGASQAYAPATISIDGGKVSINGTRVAKTAVKKVLMEHEANQPGGATTWEALKTKYLDVPGFKELAALKAAPKTTKASKAPASTASKKAAPTPASAPAEPGADGNTTPAAKMLKLKAPASSPAKSARTKRKADAPGAEPTAPAPAAKRAADAPSAAETPKPAITLPLMADTLKEWNALLAPLGLRCSITAAPPPAV